MILTIENLLNEDQLDYVSNYLQNSTFTDGKLTAGYAARMVKDNQQVKDEDLSEYVRKILFDNSLFYSFTVPNIIHNLLFSKTDIGGKYGWHVDNAFIDGNRSDVSFTIFLNDPSDYEGGELEIDPFGKFKLNKGDAIVYPSTTLHQVCEVTQGTRYVCCGWVQSKVADSAKREVIYDLEAIKQSLFAQYGKTDEFDLACKTHSNLLRMWNT